VPRRGLDAAQVVDAAAAIADREGLAAVTLSRLAAELGVRAPSLYGHVAGRDALMRALALRGVTGMARALGEAAVGRSGADALAALARAYRAYAHRRPGLYAAAQRVPAAGDEAHVAAAGGLVEMLTAALRAWSPDGEPDVHAVRAVRSALHGFVTLELDGGFGLPESRDDSYARLVAMLSAGLEAGSRA
jgi:AcrR family transcriptional regulator